MNTDEVKRYIDMAVSLKMDLVLSLEECQQLAQDLDALLAYRKLRKKVGIPYRDWPEWKKAIWREECPEQPFPGDQGE